ncbi:MAG: HAMP domain-containing histidine kinase [Cyclobacteriaceae bacterium]
MNLVTRLTLVFVGVSLLVFVAGGVITYEIFKKEIESEERRYLKARVDRVTEYLKLANPKKGFNRNKMTVELVGDDVALMSPQYSDTLVEHDYLKSMERQQKLDVVVQTDSSRYRISVYDVIVESDDVQESVKESFLKVYLLLLLTSMLAGVITSYFILKPFHLTLQSIQNFSLSNPQLPSFQKSSIKEFEKLNKFLAEMTEKVIADYKALKEFSENASHELQTPIAVAQGKLENLLQTERLDEKQLEYITSAQHSITRLSNLSKALSLLTKIENREFSQTDAVDVSDLVNRVLNEIDDLADLKGLSIDKDITASVQLIGNQTLMEIMISNVLNNAVKHNVSGGTITIHLDLKKLSITNTGEPLDSSPEELFERFRKANQSSTRLGLGLSIVKKIVDFHGLNLDYQVNDNEHGVTIHF